MIVHHRAGEFVSGVMSRQYRPAFNVVVPVVGTVAGGVTAWATLNLAGYLVAGGAAAFTYAVNLRGRRNRIRPYELAKPTKLTEDWILELQDIYFHMPKAHREPIAGLLNGAYEQIEHGNIDAVNPRLEKARALKQAIVSHNASLDTREDIQAVDQHVRALKRAIEA